GELAVAVVAGEVELPRKGDVLGRVARDDGPVHGPAELHRPRGLARRIEGFRPAAHVAEAAAVCVLLRVRRVQLLDEHVGVVRYSRGEGPRGVLRPADDDTGNARNADAAR